MDKQESIRLLDDAIAESMIKRTDLTFVEIAKLHGVGANYVYALARARKVKRKRGLGSPAFKLRKQQVA
jgi:hypothetical protein